MDDLQKRYTEWKKRVSDPNNKNRMVSHALYNSRVNLVEMAISNRGCPIHGAKVRASRQKFWSNPDNLKNQSEHSKKHWNNPDYLESVIGPQRIAICTPFGEFVSQAEFYRQTKTHFRDKQREMPHLYYYKEKGPGEATYQKVYVTPLGEFRNKNNAFKAHENNLYTPANVTQKGHAWTYQNWWLRVTKDKGDLFYATQMVRREWDILEGDKT